MIVNAKKSFNLYPDGPNEIHRGDTLVYLGVDSFGRKVFRKPGVVDTYFPLTVGRAKKLLDV